MGVVDSSLTTSTLRWSKYQDLVRWYASSEATMAKNTSFILGDHFDAFVATQVKAGRYQNATDVIRSGLRLLEERETKLQALRHALIDAERSGVAGPLDMEEIKRQARKAAGLALS